MRHGHEMLWFLRESFSECEIPLSYNAFLEHARGCNYWLRDQPFEQGMIIYIYIYLYICIYPCWALRNAPCPSESEFFCGFWDWVLLWTMKVICIEDFRKFIFLWVLKVNVIVGFLVISENSFDFTTLFGRNTWLKFTFKINIQLRGLLGG